MNHYQRLKVTPDAPIEVIRAAYRALSERLNPGDPAKETQQAELNEAYEQLRDEAARAEYDRILLVTQCDDIIRPLLDEEDGLLPQDAGLTLPPLLDQAVTDEVSGAPHVEPLALDESSLRPKGVSRWWCLAAALALMVLVLSMSYAWRQSQQIEALNQTLAEQLAAKQARFAAEDDAVLEDGLANDALDAITVEELETMSDEDLLSALKKVEADQAAEKAGLTPDRPLMRRQGGVIFKGAHPLDGDPVQLRSAQALLEP